MLEHATLDGDVEEGTGLHLEASVLLFADDGNISRRVPAALIGVGREGGWAFHTDEGATQFASEDGVVAAMTIARVLALAAARLAEPIH